MREYKEVILTEVELRQKCAEWQKVLRLEDWDVKVKLKRGRDLELGGAGECGWTIEKKQALIKITDSADYPPDCIIPQDMERTLVHELLHLHFAPFDDFESGTAEDTATEQAIHFISCALVDLARRTPKGEC